MLSTLCEIRLFAGNTPPQGWAFCNGQLFSVIQNTRLFSLLKTTFGGDGVNNFALPRVDAPMENLNYMMCLDGAYPDLSGPFVPGSQQDDSDPEDFVAYLGEIRLFSNQVLLNEKWVYCNGQTLDWNGAAAGLYELIGNKFGGTDTTFVIPNLPSPAPPLRYAICQSGLYPMSGHSEMA